MINFKSKADMGASVAILIALAIMIGAAIVQFAPAPQPDLTGSAAQRQRDALEADTKKFDKETAEAKARVDARLWKVPIDQIGPKALASVTEYVKNAHLKLIAFRPQKANQVNGLTQIPFLIAVSGSYPGVMQFLRRLDDPTVNIATSSVHISSTDGNSDDVNGNIVVVAYTKPEPPKTTKATTKGKSTENSNAKKAN